MNWIIAIVCAGAVVYHLWTLRSIDKTLKSMDNRMSRVEIRAAQSHELVKAHLGSEPRVEQEEDSAAVPGDKKDTIH